MCNGIDSDQVEYLDQVTPVVVTEGFKDIKPLPVYVSIQVGKQYEKETASGQLGTYKKIVSHESRTVHETRGAFYTVKQKQSPSPQGSPERPLMSEMSESPFLYKKWLYGFIFDELTFRWITLRQINQQMN